MKENFHKLSSIAMALLLLASTTSWTVGKHYCMGHLMDVSFFADAEDCGMNMALSDDTSEMEEKNSCCNDEIIIVDGQDDLKISFNDINLEQQFFLVAFTHSYLNSYTVETESTVSNEYYPPPLLVKDIQVLDQAFLI